MEDWKEKIASSPSTDAWSIKNATTVWWLLSRDRGSATDAGLLGLDPRAMHRQGGLGISASQQHSSPYRERPPEKILGVGRTAGEDGDQVMISSSCKQFARCRYNQRQAGSIIPPWLRDRMQGPDLPSSVSELVASKFWNNSARKWDEAHLHNIGAMAMVCGLALSSIRRPDPAKIAGARQAIRNRPIAQ